MGGVGAAIGVGGSQHVGTCGDAVDDGAAEVVGLPAEGVAACCTTRRAAGEHAGAAAVAKHGGHGGGGDDGGGLCQCHAGGVAAAVAVDGDDGVRADGQAVDGLGVAEAARPEVAVLRDATGGVGGDGTGAGTETGHVGAAGVGDEDGRFIDDDGVGDDTTAGVRADDGVGAGREVGDGGRGGAVVPDETEGAKKASGAGGGGTIVETEAGDVGGRGSNGRTSVGDGDVDGVGDGGRREVTVGIGGDGVVAVDAVAGADGHGVGGCDRNRVADFKPLHGVVAGAGRDKTPGVVDGVPLGGEVTAGDDDGLGAALVGDAVDGRTAVPRGADLLVGDVGFDDVGRFVEHDLLGRVEGDVLVAATAEEGDVDDGDDEHAAGGDAVEAPVDRTRLAGLADAGVDVVPREVDGVVRRVAKVGRRRDAGADGPRAGTTREGGVEAQDAVGADDTLGEVVAVEAEVERQVDHARVDVIGGDADLVGAVGRPRRVGDLLGGVRRGDKTRNRLRIQLEAARVEDHRVVACKDTRTRDAGLCLQGRKGNKNDAQERWYYSIHIFFRAA